MNTRLLVRRVPALIAELLDIVATPLEASAERLPEISSRVALLEIFEIGASRTISCHENGC